MKGYKHLTAAQREQVLATYRETLSVLETSSRTGATKQQIRALLKRNGMKPSGCRSGACYRHQGDVRRWGAEGVSLSEIGRRIGTTHHKVADFLRKHNIPYRPHENRMEGNGRWKGGRVIDKDGYALVKRPDHQDRNRHGYVREHRLVMEGILGRRLLPTEVVHHKDKYKLNNAPDNLEVYATNAEHLKAELTGQTPKWTLEGRARTLAGSRRATVARHAANRTPSEHDAQPSPRTTDPTPSGCDTAVLGPS